MQHRNEKQRAHKKYTKISIKRRRNLVEKVEKEGLSISKAAKTLRINISTAKLILKKYKETGTFFNKRMCKLKYERNKKRAETDSMQSAPIQQKEASMQMKIPQSAAENAVYPYFPYVFECSYSGGVLPYGMFHMSF